MDQTNPIQQPVSSAPRIIYCTACGAPAYGTFCSSCGAPLRSEPPVPSGNAPLFPEAADHTGFSQNTEPFPVSAEYAAPPKKQKHTGLIVLSILTGISVVIMLTAMLIHFILSSFNNIGINDPFYGNTQIFRGGVSTEEYDRLQLGMTYAHISSIIGGDGELIENGTDVHGDTYYIYGWPGEYGDTAAVYITFTNDVATEITVDGFLE